MTMTEASIFVGTISSLGIAITSCVPAPFRAKARCLFALMLLCMFILLALPFEKTNRPKLNSAIVLGDNVLLKPRVEETIEPSSSDFQKVAVLITSSDNRIQDELQRVVQAVDWSEYKLKLVANRKDAALLFCLGVEVAWETFPLSFQPNTATDFAVSLRLIDNKANALLYAQSHSISKNDPLIYPDPVAKGDKIQKSIAQIILPKRFLSEALPVADRRDD